MRFTHDEAVNYIESHTWSNNRAGLSRTRELLASLGNPQNELKFIHVAGSNGKGSTCAYLESILTEAGYNVGLYTSPYIENFNEQIRVGREPIDSESVRVITEEVALRADAMEDVPSRFEILLGVAMVFFKRKKADIVVLEVGLGGELDATNVILPPLAAVICNLSLEHTAYLGNTIEEIAATKGGIIKTGSLAVVYDLPPAPRAVLEKICEDRKVPLTIPDFSHIVVTEESLFGSYFSFDMFKKMHTPLMGRHQIKNAVMALSVVSILREQGFKISEEGVRKGLANTTWPARLEILMKYPPVILDGAHNLQGAEALSRALRLIPEGKVNFLLGILADKDAVGMLDELIPFAKEIICVSPPSERAESPERLIELINNRVPAEAAASVREGLSYLISKGEPFVCAGSLYMAGEVRSLFSNLMKRHQRSRVKAALKALSPEEKAAQSREICREIVKAQDVSGLKGAKVVLSFKNTPDEPDLSLLHDELTKAGVKIAYPRTLGEGIMEARIPWNPEAFTTGAYGISEPDPEKSDLVSPENIDFVMVPCLAIDDDGHRLGHGGGYYDRFLPKCRSAAFIPVTFPCQRLAEVAVSPYDFRL